MFPDGFHPVQPAYKRDYSGWATYLPRSAVGVKYYFADFGISVHIPTEDRPRFVTGHMGRDQDPPELSSIVPYDPFKLDIFIIGNTLKQEFCDVIVPPPCRSLAKLMVLQTFTNVEFLQPLARRMTHQDPEQRPTAEEALREWSELREGIYTINKEWRPRPRAMDVLGTAFLDVVSLCELSMHCTRAVFEGLCGQWPRQPS